ncbi:hypothetical protein RFI_37855, partial [Reticulomyxa filosa]
MLDQILSELDNAYFEEIIKPNKISGCCPSSETQLMPFADAAKNNQFVIAVSYLQNMWVVGNKIFKSNSGKLEEWVNIFKYLDTRMSAYDTEHMNEWRLSENFRCAAHWWAKKRLADKLHELCEQHFTAQKEELKAEQISGWNRFNNRVKGLETDVQLGDHVVTKFFDQIEYWTMEEVRKCIEARIEEIRENLGSKRLTGMIWKKAFETDSCEYAYQLITNSIQVYYENFDREFDNNVSHLKEQPVYGDKTISKYVQKLSLHFFFFCSKLLQKILCTFLIFEKKLNINLKQNKQDLLKDCCLQVAIGTTQFICRVDIFQNRVSNKLNDYLNKPYVPKLDEVLKKILNDIKNTMRSTCLGCME